jgi:hypothetical protein
MGRKPINKRAMTAAERQSRRRAKLRAPDKILARGPKAETKQSPNARFAMIAAKASGNRPLDTSDRIGLSGPAKDRAFCPLAA